MASLNLLPPPNFTNRFGRMVWLAVYWVFFRFSPTIFHPWRCFLLRLFGAKVGRGAHPYPSCQIWAPWNLIMEEKACLAPGVICYNVALVHLGANTIISQRSNLCTASHDFDRIDFPLTGAPIILEENVWVTSEVFIGPGVKMEYGSVALARAVVTRNVERLSVVGGNPANPIRERQYHTS